jgi:hypothetical protein
MSNWAARLSLEGTRKIGNGDCLKMGDWRNLGSRNNLRQPSRETRVDTPWKLVIIFMSGEVGWLGRIMTVGAAHRFSKSCAT